MEDADGAKGVEEEELGLEGKSDSFRSPTEHGVLTPGLPARVTVSEGEVFHAWTFTLTDEASIAIQTQDLADNLDTVMYLYRRAPGATSWGRYVAKNDDHQKNLWSRIEEDVTEPGEYRVIVKPFKSAMRGGLSVEMSCDGSGCPAAPTSFTCEGEKYAGFSGVNDMCAQSVLDILSAPVVPIPDDDDSIACMNDLAREHYTSYWESLTGEVDELYVDSTRLGDVGVLVSVDMGGDEDQLTYLFDADGQLLVFYHSEQSPYWEWTCPEGQGETSAVLDDDGDCLYTALTALPSGAQDEVAEGTIGKGSENDSVRYALEVATEELSLSEDTEYVARLKGEGVARVDVAGYTYTVMKDWRTPILLSRTVRGESTFYCQSPED